MQSYLSKKTSKKAPQAAEQAGRKDVMPEEEACRKERAALDMQELEDDLAVIAVTVYDEKGNRQAAHCIFHFKAFLYKSQKRDLLVVPRAVLDCSTRGSNAFVKLKQAGEIMNKTGINYVPLCLE